jgi:hypothetical protein
MRGIIVGGMKAWNAVLRPFNDIRTMKVRSAVKRLCKDCKIGPVRSCYIKCVNARELLEWGGLGLGLG